MVPSTQMAYFRVIVISLVKSVPSVTTVVSKDTISYYVGTLQKYTILQKIWINTTT